MRERDREESRKGMRETKVSSLYKHWCLRDTHLSPLHSRGCRFSCIKMLIFKGDEMTTERQSHATTDTVCSVNRKSKNRDLHVWEKNMKEGGCRLLIHGWEQTHFHPDAHKWDDDMNCKTSEQALPTKTRHDETKKNTSQEDSQYTTSGDETQVQETRRREGCVSNNSKDKTMEN